MTRRRQQMPPYHAPMRVPGYLHRLLQAGDLGAFKPGTGTVTIVNVVHGDGCERPHGGPCTCQPDITAKGEAGTFDIDQAGHPRQGGAA